MGKPCVLLDSFAVGKPIALPTALSAPRVYCLRQEGGRPDGVGQRKCADTPLEQWHVLISLSGDHSVVTIVMKIQLEEGVSAR